MIRTLQVLFIFLILTKASLGQGSSSPGVAFLALSTDLMAAKVKKPAVKEAERPMPAPAPAQEVQAQQAEMQPVEAQIAITAPAQPAENTATAKAAEDMEASMAPIMPHPEDPAVSFYPNPVKDYLNVQFPVRGSHTVRVFNIVGEKVAEKTVLDDDIVVVDLSNAQSGVFFLSYEYGGKVYTKKFSKG